jgi:hypothetical protein
VRRVTVVTAAFVAAVAVWGLSLPPRRIILGPDWSDHSVSGVLHVHSRQSDGRGTLDEIAAAAARAKLQFVVVTDHGDATRAPEPPSYRSGVLLLDGVEISTRGGHYVALGLPQAPYVLGGEAADVVEDVRRLGGFGIAAHPDSPKVELRWTDWQTSIDAIELINPDTSWRVHAFTGGMASKWLLLRSLLTYPLRSPETISALLTDSATLRGQWLAKAQDRPVVALAGADAHAKLALRDSEPGDNRNSVPIPSYQSSFASVSVHVTPEAAFSGDAAADAKALLGGLRRGHVYVAVDGWATPPAFAFTATSGAAPAQQGDAISADAPVVLHVRSNAPAGFQTIVRNGTQPISEHGEPSFEVPVGAAPGVYSVEIRRPNARGEPPWISSNPIYVGSRPELDGSETGSTQTLNGQPLFDGHSTAGWSYESDKSSLAVVDVAELVTGSRVRLRYGLAGGALAGQYAAAAVETPSGVERVDGVGFVVQAEAPMRISVQVRADVAGGPPERWERSVFVDANEQSRMVRFATMTPVGQTHTPAPPAGSVRAIMFVVDTTNTRPGASGRLWLGDVRLVSMSPPTKPTGNAR